MTGHEKTDRFLKAYGPYLLGTVLIGLFAYFALMAEELNNNWDGIWHLSNFVAGDFEISLGRGFERYADRARFGLVSSPLNALLCLLCIGAANILIIRRFELENTVYAWLLVFLTTVNPAVSDTFSYIYLAVNYLLAYLCSVVSFYLLTMARDKTVKRRVLAVLTGSLFLAFSMEFYQAYFCVLCTLLLFYAIRLILTEKPLKEIGAFYADGFLGIAAGGLLYFVLTNVLLKHAGITLADYKGVSDVSLGTILLSLPMSVVQCYKETANYLFGVRFWTNLEFARFLVLLYVVLLVALVVWQIVRLVRVGIGHLILFAVSLLLVPVAACAILVLAVGNIMTGIMAMGLLLSVVLTGILAPEGDGLKMVLRRAFLVFLAVFAWYSVSAVTNDQLAIREGRTATVTLAQGMLVDLCSGHYLEEERTVAFVGRPGNNPLFAKSVSFDRANEYAQFGYWSTDPRNSRVSWYGVFTNYLGVVVPLCDDVTFDAIRNREDVAAMPVWPAEGSIAVVDDVVVVKVSDLYR